MSPPQGGPTLCCADCSSLGLDTCVYRGEKPTSGVCTSCGGPWPLHVATNSMDRAQRLRRPTPSVPPMVAALLAAVGLGDSR